MVKVFLHVIDLLLFIMELGLQVGFLLYQIFRLLLSEGGFASIVRIQLSEALQLRLILK